MALTFGSGEQVSRIRRGLDVKGRVILGLDETVVPVVQVGDLTAPPIRRSPVRFWIGRGAAAVVGEFSRVRIFHQTAVDQLIDRIWISTAAGQVVQIGQGPSGDATGAVAARTTEIVNADSGGVIARSIGLFSRVDSVTPSSLSGAFMRVLTSATETTYLPVEIVIPAMPDPTGPVTNAPTLTIEGTVANEQIDFTVSGLWYDALPLNFRT